MFGVRHSIGSPSGCSSTNTTRANATAHTMTTTATSTLIPLPIYFLRCGDALLPREGVQIHRTLHHCVRLSRASRMIRPHEGGQHLRAVARRVGVDAGLIDARTDQPVLL